jgi:hypothetical protein
MMHHFRFITPLLSVDEDELTPLHYYDSAIQLARNSRSEPTEEEFEIGILVAEEIKQRCDIVFLHSSRLTCSYSLNECLDAMNEDSSGKSTGTAGT